MKNKRITKAVSAVMLLALLVSMLPVTGMVENVSAETAASSTGPPTFSDVEAGTWYYKGVIWAYGEKITVGTTNSTFSPKCKLSFAEVATFLYRYAYSPKAHYTKPALAVYQGHYYYTPLSWCCDFGLIEPALVTGGNSPKNKLTRSDFVGILYRYAVLWERRPVECWEGCLDPYEDTPVEAEARRAWSWAIDRGIIVGTDPHHLSPDQNLTRAQFVMMLYRYNSGKTAAWLRSETVLGYRVRGWQRRYLECAELAYGVPWQDHAYSIGSNGIPILIDCSGVLEWAFCYSGLKNVPDLESIDLWNSSYFDIVASKPNNKTGYRFLNELIDARTLKLGDMIFCGNSSNQYCYHMMMFLGRKGGSIYVLHSRGGVSASGETGVQIEALPNVEGSWYLSGIYGIKRFNP